MAERATRARPAVVKGFDQAIMAWEGRPGVRDWSRRRRSVSRASQDRRLKSDARRNRLIAV